MSPLHRLALGATALALATGATTATAASTTALKASLKGSNEAPQKGDADGSGRATVRIKGTRLCFTLKTSGTDKLVAGHIHRGRAGDAGAIVVPLFMGTAKKKGCVSITGALAKEIKTSPRGFYFNVHSAAFPGGALRGQLAKG